MLTSTCWQEISLSNTVELTTVTPQKQKTCRFKRRFLPVFRKFQRFHCLPSRSKSRDAPWLGGFVFTYVPVSMWQPMHRRQCEGRQWNLWNFRKLAKTRRLKAADLLLLWVTAVSSTVFEREISCQHVNVNMRMLRFCSVEKSDVISRWGSVRFCSGLSPLSLLYVFILYYYRPMDSPSD